MAADIDYSVVDDRELNIDDQLDVLSELTMIERKADKLGIGLGLPAGSYEPTLNAVIEAWLNQSYDVKRHGLPSYRRLVKAVASRVGGSNPALAKKIAGKHPAQALQSESVVASDDSYPVTTLPQSTASSTSRVTHTEGIGDMLQKFLPQKPKDLPVSFRPYPMTSSPHGECLIINNMNFKGKQRRVGSDVDERSVSKLFSTLDYHLYEEKVHRDCTSKEMSSLLKAVADSDHSQHDSVMLFLASHGTTGYLYGSDDRLISIDEIHTIFANSKTLIGKPKIVFIQACRGSQLPEGRVVQDDGDDDEPCFIPRDSDFFFGYATTPDTKACRFTDIGSWYVIELCKMLQNYHTEFDLLSMVTAVHYEITCNKEYIYEHRVKHGSDEMSTYKQCPQLVSTLNRPVYFKLE